jgi:hypothetical protein
MIAQTLADVSHRVAQTGTISDDDVLAARRCVYVDGAISRAEAEGLYAIEQVRTSQSNSWSMLFVEALSDLVLNQERPVGYVTADTAQWLMALIGRRKQPSMDGDMALVANIIEKAREVPAAFSAFALRLAKDAVIYGDGPDARGRLHASGRVDEADVAMLQRILWGAGSEGLLAVSRDEAEALFAIADATTGAANDPAFDDLFAKAIGNYLLGATGRHVPDRETALRWDNAGSYKTDMVAFMTRLLSSAPDVPAALTERTLAQYVDDEHAHRNMVRDVEIEVAGIMTSEKAAWLRDRIDRNGVMNGPEKALVRFVTREAAALDASMKDVAAKVA